MNIKLLTEQHLEFLSSSESIHVKFHIVGNHMSRLTYNEKVSDIIVFGKNDASLQKSQYSFCTSLNLRQNSVKSLQMTSKFELDLCNK